MATQDEDGISFAVNHEQQNLRLLELPSDLIDLITSQTRPRYGMAMASDTVPPKADCEESLYLKSTVPSTGTPVNAVLCTDSKTYQIRQVQSSNSVFILQPSEIAPDPWSEDAVPARGLSAIARCTTTLELIPANVYATALLKNLLHVYHVPRPRVPSGEVAAPTTDSGACSKSAVYDDTPVSLQEFENAWVELCAFENDSKSWIPTAACLRGIWQSIISAVTLKGLNLQTSVYIGDIIGSVEEDGFPKALVQAVVGRLQSEKIIPMDGWATLSPEKCIPWVGAVTLASEPHETEGIATSEFLQQWQDLLPEVWRQHAKLEVLEGMYSTLSSGRILSYEDRNQVGSARDARLLNTNGRRPGKWHEKFKNARR